jgi:hypothetical protein
VALPWTDSHTTFLLEHIFEHKTFNDSINKHIKWKKTYHFARFDCYLCLQYKNNFQPKVSTFKRMVVYFYFITQIMLLLLNFCWHIKISSAFIDDRILICVRLTFMWIIFYSFALFSSSDSTTRFFLRSIEEDLSIDLCKNAR